jgi:hypothetical protein
MQYYINTEKRVWGGAAITCDGLGSESASRYYNGNEPAFGVLDGYRHRARWTRLDHVVYIFTQANEHTVSLRY